MLIEDNQAHVSTNNNNNNSSNNNNNRHQLESLFSMFQIPLELSLKVPQVALILLLLLGDNRIFSPENSFLTKCYRMDLKASTDSQGLNAIPGLAT